MAIQTQAAPAKLNLTLDVLGRRPDGYHEMRMIMQTVSLCDQVSLEETEAGFTLSARHIRLPAGKKSMEQQAAEAFFSAVGRSAPGLRVTLEKLTPAYAGLGGGSADAAALLRMLRARYAPELPGPELERIGLRTGSDVPFCIRGGTALAAGRGEILTDLPPMPDCRFLICKPEFDLPTASMFARLRPQALRDRPDSAAMAAAIAAGDLEAAARFVGNVFETALETEERREIEAIKETLLRHGALNAAMSGSGPAVFGLFAPGAETAGALEALRRSYSQVFLAEPVRRLL